MKLRESIFTKQIETDRSVQTVWCEYAWKMSVNSKGSTLSIHCGRRRRGPVDSGGVRTRSWIVRQNRGLPRTQNV